MLETLKKKPVLKENVLKLIDLSKAVPLLEQLHEDPRDYENVHHFILRKHYLSMTHEYSKWFVFEDKMSFNPMFLKWYCEEQELDQKIK